MKKVVKSSLLLLPGLVLVVLVSCHCNGDSPGSAAIAAINLKRGNLVVCGPAGKQYGSVSFETSCPGASKEDFNLGMALLHSFEYDEAEKVFAKVIADEPSCAMAYWGVAMSNYHQVWPSPPLPAELDKGLRSVTIAQSLTNKTKREGEYIDAIAQFYKDWPTVDHHTRALAFEKAMEKLYAHYPSDKEAAIFYALSLDGAADPMDKSYANQRKAGAILTALYPGEPNHPGIVHYLIHSYDYPELAALALPSARKYASIAPASAHAQHMPSHIFTRLGLWNESITSNLISISSARCYAEGAGIKGHWDEEIHGLDYLMYAYLQKGDNKLAKEQYDYLQTITGVYPVNFKDAYAFASIPSRYVLENKMWKDAAGLNLHRDDFPWVKFPWQRAIIYFTHTLGYAHTGQLDSANAGLIVLQAIRDTLARQKDPYKANLVDIQLKAAEAWIRWKEGKNAEALRLMNLAADMEDKTEKSPVTPGEVLPARELLGDLLLQLNKPADALIAYEADLLRHPNRFNGLYGAGLAAERSGNKEKAIAYYRQLMSVVAVTSDRKEVEEARKYLR